MVRYLTKCESLRRNKFKKWHQFSSVAQSCPILCDPVDSSLPGFPVNHQLPKLAQTHVHWVSDAIQPSHPLSSPSPPAFNLSQHQCIFQWVNSSYQVAKVLKFQLQHQSFQRIFISLVSKGLASLLQHHSLKPSIRGEEPRWRRSRTGRTLSPPQIHQKSI